jgi:hypothetical protein
VVVERLNIELLNRVKRATSATEGFQIALPYILWNSG